MGHLMIIESWYHKPGKHCASSALHDLSQFYHHHLSEPFCFGLGEGLAFFSVPMPGGSPSHRVFLRSVDLEGVFFRNLGVPFEWKRETDSERALERAEAAIQRNVPVLLRTDLRYLDYYKTKTHFAGHAIILWGIDREKGEAYVSDTHWEGLQSLPIESLKKARWVESFPIQVQNDFFEVVPFKLPQDWAPVLRKAMRGNAEAMLSLGPVEGACGVFGMERWAEEIPQWAEKEDAAWTCRFMYQMIEKRGTGGGGFRRLYAGFVKEALPFLPELRAIQASERMESIADRWEELALLMRGFSEKEDIDILNRASKKTEELARMERSFYQSILDSL